ncbi:MAG: dCTP deaminase [Promethearchaeota archaeon]
MIKSGNSVRQLMFSKENIENRLIITPILDFNGQVKPGSTSVDLRLGCIFKIPKRSQIKLLDPEDKDYIIKKEKYFEKIYVNIGETFILHPRQFVLGQTLEWIHLPNNLCGYIIGKSTWGRDGLVIATASGVHPCYSGPLTLELTNLGEIPIKLIPGYCYSQLFINTVEQPDKKSYGDSSLFIGDPDIGSGEIPSREKELIEKFKRNLPPKLKLE